jgi:small subunit ribosomal protein S6
VRLYEVVFIAAPTLAADALNTFVAQMQTVVESKNGKVVKVENWGKKSLAYKIKRFREAYYVVFSLEADGAVIAELERRFRVTDFVIRFLSVRIDEDLKRSEKLRAARSRKAVSQPSPRPREPETGIEPEAAPI